jgi:UDP-N-acetylglucosamine:LPS N-acetylglucosamine transferase
VLATKPGPGSLAEALHCRVPAVVPCNAHTIPQERYNATFLAENDLGVVVRQWREIPAAVSALAADPVRRARLGAAARALVESNRGAKDKSLAVISQLLPLRGGSMGVVRPFRLVH